MLGKQQKIAIKEDDGLDDLSLFTKPKIVFKRCGEWLVYLEKMENTITNEERPSLEKEKVMEEEKLHAKYRGNTFLVVWIEHLWEENKGELLTCNEIQNTYYKKKIITYRTGEIIEEPEFDLINPDKCCSRGIHYFLDKDTAKNYLKSGISLHIDGTYYEYYENGKIFKKYTYINGKREGDYIKNFDDGTPYISCNYHLNKKNGIQTIYYEGCSKIKSTTNYEGGKKEGQELEYSSYYVNSIIIIADKNYVNGLLEGEFQTFYHDGKPKTKSFFVGGKEEGDYFNYNSAGRISEQCFFVNGKKHGIYLGYNFNGMMMLEKTYVEGKTEGRCIAYDYIKGERVVIHISYFKNDKLEGESDTFYDDGVSLQKKENYINGKMVKQIHYDREGNILGTKIYEEEAKNEEEKEEEDYDDE
jgi:antitoxin component YwqK of YwqJK toxin-antitoxin module